MSKQRPPRREILDTAPPSNTDLERETCGALLLADAATLSRSLAQLAVADFTYPWNGVYKLISKAAENQLVLRSEATLLDALLVLDGVEAVKKALGDSWAVDIHSAMWKGFPGNLEYYWWRLRTLRIRRAFRFLGERMLIMSDDQSHSIGAMIGELGAWHAKAAKYAAEIELYETKARESWNRKKEHENGSVK